MPARKLEEYLKPIRAKRYQPGQVKNTGAQIRRPIAPVKKYTGPRMRRASGGSSRRYY